MNKKILEYVRTLTENDTKNLSQKALKVSEEAGELAKAVLPFENAAGTTHRFIAREHILEEVADVFLTGISVAYELGFTDEEIEEMIERKMVKWHGLQEREAKMAEKIPYEIHITVEDANLEDFRTACDELGVKPIVLALQVGQEVVKDVMTSSKHYGNNASAYEEMMRISDGLCERGFVLVRHKIETVPWHPAAPRKSEAHDMPKDCYFETHVGVLVDTLGRYDLPIGDLASELGVHLSRNAFKTVTSSASVRMVTLRWYTGYYEDFMEAAKHLRERIKSAGYAIENVVTEFSIYDTKVNHDANWIKK